MGIVLRLLMIEDSEEDVALMLQELKRGGFDPIVHRRIETANALNEALDKEDWDVVIADYALPQFSGMEALAILNVRGLDLPFIIVSGTIGEELAVDAMRAGAHDYVMKGNLKRLVPAIQREMYDASQRRNHRRAEERLHHDALYDALTGLPNRALFMDRLSHAITRARGRGQQRFGVLFLDLDRFKMIIESLGHQVGDDVLIAFAHLLQRSVRPGDTVARLGGDEFTVLIEDLPDPGFAVQAAQQIHNELMLPLDVKGHEVFVTASIGVLVNGAGYDRAEDLLRDVNTAMHRAKSTGRARHEVFDATMHADAVSLLRLETDLRRAMDRQELKVFYQPIVSLRTGRISGFEALVRWEHPERGMIGPDQFIPLCEDTGLIVPVGGWVFREACWQLREWQKLIPEATELTMGVNLSGRQFLRPEMVNEIKQTLRETGLNPRMIHLEMTESVIMTDAGMVGEILRQIKALAIQVHIDDFGTGYSSLSHLHRFPIDTLKIDRSFVAGLGIQGENQEIIQTIVLLAHNLGLDIIAEGIETVEQRDLLKALKCEYGQGYLFSRPMDPEAATAMIRSWPQW